MFLKQNKHQLIYSWKQTNYFHDFYGVVLYLDAVMITVVVVIVVICTHTIIFTKRNEKRNYKKRRKETTEWHTSCSKEKLSEYFYNLILFKCQIITKFNS